MYSLKNEGSQQLEKVQFPVDIAVSDVSLHSVERNQYITGIVFNFNRKSKDSIAFLSDSLLPPRREWFTESKEIGGKIITPEEDFNSSIRQFTGYIRHLLVAAGLEPTVLDDIRGESLDELIDNIVEKVNPLIDKNNTFYLKTIKDKKGYTKLPKYRGSGVAQSTNSGYPTHFSYTTHEKNNIEMAATSGVEDNTSNKKTDDSASATSVSPNTGLDF